MVQQGQVFELNSGDDGAKRRAYRYRVGGRGSKRVQPGGFASEQAAEPETVEKLRWLLAKSVRVFGERRLGRLQSAEIAAWRMTVPAGHRFEATQVLAMGRW